MSDHKPQVEQMWHDWFMTDAFKVEKAMVSFSAPPATCPALQDLSFTF